MWRLCSSSVCLVSLGVVLLAIVYWPEASLAKGGRGGGGGGRAGGGFGRSSSGARSSYGSAARTSSSRVSSSSGQRATQYGSSAPTGFSSGSGYGSSGRVGSPSGTAYRPSSTFSRVASPGTARANSVARPQVHTPTAAKSQPTPVAYSPTYNTYYGGGGMGAGSYGSRSSVGGSSMLLAGGAGLIGGYYMGRMMGGLYRPYGYGYGYSPYQSYVPYRDQYGSYYATTTPSPLISGSQPAPAEADKQLDVCTLARWNRELPFTELPNMALQFLMNDSVTGISTTDKAKFVQGFFKNASEGYKTYNSSADIFTIPPNYDLASCNFQNAADVDVSKMVSSGTVEEPLITALRAIVQQYASTTDQNALSDVVNAVKACLPRPTTDGQPPINLQISVLPCLDYSLSPDQLMRLEKPRSVFGNEEVCHRQLNPDMFKCIPDNNNGCTQEHLVALNVFARNYYLCATELDNDTLHKLQVQGGGQVNSGGGSWWSSRAVTSSGRGPLTILLISIVTLSVSTLLS